MNPASVENLGLTAHAQARAQARAIPQIIVELLMNFGTSEPAPGGVERIFFDSRSRRDVRSIMGGKRGVRTVERWFNTCAIVGDQGRIVTLYRD